MTIVAQDEKQAFLEGLREQFAATPQQGALYRLRAKAWEHFLAIGLPLRQAELFRYVPLTPLYQHPFSFSVEQKSGPSADVCLPNQAVTIYLRNGCFMPQDSQLELLPKQVVVSSLAEAATTYGTFLHNHWMQTLQDEKDPFALLNQALSAQGLFIYIPPHVVLETPIYIVHIIDQPEAALFLQPRLHLFAGAFSEVRLQVVQKRISGSQHAVNSVLDFSIEEGARAHCEQLFQEDAEVWHFAAIRAVLKRAAFFESVSMTNGSRSIRQDYRVSLIGEQAEASLNGIWLLKEKRQSHLNVLVEHRAPLCRSRQLFKGILSEASRSSFEGKILVREEAQQTDAYQRNHNLVLSDRAIAYSKPNLEIFADDVKASHGATVGQLDKEQLFYLQSRGLSREAAHHLLLGSFCREVVDLMTSASIRTVIEKEIEKFAE